MADTVPNPSPAPRPRSRFWARVRVPTLLRRGMPIVIATLLSRPLGYVRVAIQAWLFGATAAMDAFVLAFSVPSTLQVILLTGPLSGVLVPTLTAYRHNRQALTQLFNSLLTWCLLAGLVIAGLAALGAPWLMAIAGPGFSADTRLLATRLFCVMLPMLVMQALLSVCKGALNTLDHYGMPEYAGVAFNIVMILTPLFLAARYGVMSLAIGAAIGGVVQCLMQLPVLARYGIRYRPRLRLGLDLRQFVRLAEGAFLSTMITPLNALIDRALASLLFPGAIASLHYAYLLFLLPASLCVVPLSTVSLTELAGLYHQGNIEGVRQHTRRTLRLVLLLTIPMTIVGVVFAEPLTRLVYEYGRFQATDTRLAAQALRAYLLGLPLYGMTHLLTRSFYATHDTMTPACVNCGALVLNIVSDLVLMRLCGHWGIALASTVVMGATTVALAVLFQRRCARLRAQPPAHTPVLDSPEEVG